VRNYGDSAVFNGTVFIKRFMKIRQFSRKFIRIERRIEDKKRERRCSTAGKNVLPFLVDTQYT